MAEQEFLKAFREENKIDAVKFMKIWKEMDTDSNGFMSSKELTGFLKSVGVKQDKVKGFSERILSLYDVNNDGKLGLSELSKIVQSDQNILQAFVDGDDLTPEKFDEIFKHYDQDNSGNITGEELLGFLKDMRDTQGEDVEMQDIEEYKKFIMSQADENGDGKLSKDELKALFFG